MISAIWGVAIGVLWSWWYLCVSLTCLWGRSLRALTDNLSLNEWGVCASPGHCWNSTIYKVELRKKLSLFLLIIKPFKKVVFLELVDRTSLVQMKRSKDWYTAGGSDLFTDPMSIGVLRLSFSDCTALERELWKEKTKKFKVPRWWSDAVKARGVFLTWFVWFGLQKAYKQKHTATLLFSK